MYVAESAVKYLAAIKNVLERALLTTVPKDSSGRCGKTAGSFSNEEPFHTNPLPGRKILLRLSPMA